MVYTITVLWFVLKNINVYQNLLKTVRTQRKRYWKQMNDIENLWIKPHIRLIDTQFHATFMAFETGFFIKEPAPIFFSMAQVCEISWWNHISDYHLVLKPYNLICCQFPPLHYADVLSWKSTFNIGVNEDDFSVQIERHRCFKFHDIAQHAPFHSNLKCHYEKLTVVSTVYPKKYAHGFVVFCFVVVMQSFIMNSHEVFIHLHQGCFAGTGAIVRLPQCQWSKPDGYGKISQCITITKHSKAKTVCIFLGIYCKTAVGFIRYGRHWRDRTETTICVISKAHTKPVRCIHRVYDVRNKVYKLHRLVWECCRDISEWKSRVTKSTVLQDLGRMMPIECRDEADCVSNWAVGANCW